MTSRPNRQILDSVADELVQLVDGTATDLASLSDDRARSKPSPDRWSVQEIVGHLLDSAVNNHHRFVRAQQAESLDFPKYDQEFWVKAQDYNGLDWSAVITLWRLYNLHLAAVIRHIEPARLGTLCTIGPYEPVTLGFLVQDYLAHIKHHLPQIRALVSRSVQKIGRR